MSWHESVAERRRGAPAGMQGRGSTVKARGRAHRVTGCVLHTVQCTPAPEEHSLVQMCWSIVWFHEHGVCVCGENECPGRKCCGEEGPSLQGGKAGWGVYRMTRGLGWGE